MKKFIAIFALMFSFNTFAALTTDSVANAGFSRLTEAQKADVIKQIADASSKNKDAVVPSEEKVEKWVKIGSQVGQGLAGAAKELGVAVNDFSKTPVGQLTMMLIVWHMVGGVLVHIFGGLLIMVVGLSFIYFMFKRAYPDKITYSKEHKNIFGNFVVESAQRTAVDDENAAGWLFAAAIVILVGTVTIFTF
jgi:hypothetical protein